MPDNNMGMNGLAVWERNAPCTNLTVCAGGVSVPQSALICSFHYPAEEDRPGSRHHRRRRPWRRLRRPEAAGASMQPYSRLREAAYHRVLRSRSARELVNCRAAHDRSLFSSCRKGTPLCPPDEPMKQKTAWPGRAAVPARNALTDPAFAPGT